MSTHLKVVPEVANDGGSGPSSVWRDMVLASVVVGILLLGIDGGAVAPHSSAEAQASTASSPAVEPQQDLVYFPSQYVNQGTAIEEDIPTF